MVLDSLAELTRALASNGWTSVRVYRPGVEAKGSTRRPERPRLLPGKMPILLFICAHT